VIKKEKFMDKDIALKHLFGLMLESLMEGERTAVLGYGKHDYSGYGSPNSRNGYYRRNLLTGLGLYWKNSVSADAVYMAAGIDDRGYRDIPGNRFWRT